MDHNVAFDDVRRLIGEFGSRATLVTVGESRRPHIVTARIEIEDKQLVAEVGERTRSNVLVHPDLALVWEPSDGGEYQLILDGHVGRLGEPNERRVSSMRITVVGGILHRLAGLPEGPPTCLSLAADANMCGDGNRRGG